MRPLRHPILILALGLSALTATRAAAQPAAESPDPLAEEVVPPRPRLLVPPRWPRDVGPANAADVLLELTIDEQGRVSQARVLESRGEALDQAALEAILASEFEPATRGGAPVAVRVRYSVRMERTPGADSEPPRDEAPASPVPELGTDGGVVPAPPAVQADAADDRADALSPGDEGFGATAEIAAPPREVTRRSVPRERLTRIPGTSGDALRAIEVMPGVGRTSSTQGDPIIRGAAWSDSRSYVSGVPVPLLFHFGGVKSAFNSRLLERVDLYPGNFSVRYGRATGGVVDAIVRRPQEDRWHAAVEISLLDSMALVEGPLADRGGLALAARRSNVDVLLDPLLPEGDFSMLAAPVYWDYQGVGSFRLGSAHRLELLSFGSRDSLMLFFDDPSPSDAALRGKVGVTLEYHRVQARLASELAPGFTQNLALTWGKLDGTQAYGPTGARFDVQELFGRGEWNVRVSPHARIDFGFDVESMFLSGRYAGSVPPQSEGDPNLYNRTSTQERLTVVGDFGIVRPAVYAEVELRPTPTLSLVPGVRADWFSDIEAWAIDPRLAARYEAGPTTAVKWGVGIFSQHPIYYEAIDGFGNPELEPVHALHTSAGVEQGLGEHVDLGVETFYKRLVHRIVTTEGGQPPVFRNDGVGRIFGGELSARLEWPRTFGYLAYTLSRSERRDRSDAWRPFDKDQTHVLALTGSHDLGRGWELGARFRLVSGDPYTPVAGAVYDAGIDQYRPIWGRPFSRRNPMFHQLDLRVEKEWQLRMLKVAAYLDLQNAYNAEHQEGFDYSYDYTRREVVSGMPIFPNLGLRGEL